MRASRGSLRSMCGVLSSLFMLVSLLVAESCDGQSKTLVVIVSCEGEHSVVGCSATKSSVR